MSDAASPSDGAKLAPRPGHLGYTRATRKMLVDGPWWRPDALARGLVPSLRVRRAQTKRKPAKSAVPQAAAPVDMSATDRAALIAAYQSGVITMWKHDGERGYRLTVPGRQDD